MWLQATGATMHVWKTHVTQEAVLEHRIRKLGEVLSMLTERGRPGQSTCRLAWWS